MVSAVKAIFLGLAFIEVYTEAGRIARDAACAQNSNQLQASRALHHTTIRAAGKCVARVSARYQYMRETINLAARVVTQDLYGSDASN